MKTKSLALILLAGAAAATQGHSQSAWLPNTGELKATPGFSFSTFDKFWVGTSRENNPPNDESLDQYTTYLSLEYGILDRLAADATLGYAWTDTDAFVPGGADDDGLTDTTLGLRYQLVDEFDANSEFTPTVAVRAAAIIAGTYDENLAFSAGDGAHGFESSLLLGKFFGESGFGTYGEIGYRVRESPVPDDAFGTVGVFKQLGPVTLSFGYRHIQGLSGRDIDANTGNASLGSSHTFPALKEINQLLEGGVSFTDKGGRNYQVSVAKSVDGRNTGDKWVVGANVTIPFRVR